MNAKRDDSKEENAEAGQESNNVPSVSLSELKHASTPRLSRGKTIEYRLNSARTANARQDSFLENDTYGCRQIYKIGSSKPKTSNEFPVLPLIPSNNNLDRQTKQSTGFESMTDIHPVLPPINKDNMAPRGEVKETPDYNEDTISKLTVSNHQKESSGPVVMYKSQDSVRKSVLPPIKTDKDKVPQISESGIIGATNRRDKQTNKYNNTLRYKGITDFKNNIEEENSRIKDLANYATEKDWNKVWEILGSPKAPKNEHLVNVIYDDIEWGLVHQAVHQNNCSAVETLLSFQGCDPSIQTKMSKLECDESERWDVTNLANSIECKICKDVISNALSGYKKQLPETYYKQEDEEFPLFALVVAMHKQTFHPGIISPSLTIIEVLENIFTDINSSDIRWLKVQALVCLCIQSKCKEKSEAVNKSKTRDEFYKALIDVYTAETNSQLYSSLNEALRRQRNIKYQPTALDLELGPFILMFQMILLFWKSIQKENKQTYRRMLLTNNDLDLYQVGVKFSWMAFVSSAHNKDRSLNFPTNLSNGENIVDFIIDNCEECIWQPRNIEIYASLAESERTYPAGATFQVTKREKRNESTLFELKLIQK